MPFGARYLATTSARSAHSFARFRLPSDTATNSTRLLALKTDACIASPQRFIKADRDLVLEILPSLGFALLCPSAKDLAEEFTEIGLPGVIEIESLETEPATL